MPDWNPNDPTTIGVEYRPTIAGTTRIANASAPTAVIDSTLSETIESLFARITCREPSRLAIDIYDATTGETPWIRGNIDQALFRTAGTASVEGTNKFFNENLGTTGLWQSVNEGQTDVDESNYLVYVHSGSGSHAITFRAGSTAEIPDPPDFDPGFASVAWAGRRLIQLKVVAYVANTHASKSARVTGILSMNGSERPAGEEIIPPGGDYARYEWAFDHVPSSVAVNSSGGFQWPIGHLPEFFTTGDWSYGLRCRTGYSGAGLRVAAVYLVALLVNEERVATSYADCEVSGEGPEWARFSVRDLTTGDEAAWSKQAGRRYWLVMHKPASEGQAYWHRLAGATLGGHATQATPLRRSGYTAGSDVTWPRPLVTTEAFALRFAPSAGITSGDSQPYGAIAPTAIYAGVSAEQEITTPPVVGSPYGIVTVMVRAAASVPPSSPLTVAVYRRSTGALVATADVTVAEALGPDAEWQIVSPRYLSAFAILASTQYFVQFSSATPSDRPWYVAALTVGDETDTIFSPAGFGGQTDVATVGGADTPGQDLIVALVNVPLAVDDPTLDDGLLTLTARTGCAIQSVGYATVTWSPNATLGGMFGYWEIQRDDDGTWRTIAELTDEATVVFYDFESRRNLPAEYRVRAVRADGAQSDWAASVSSVTVVGDEDGVWFTSNEDPDLTLGFYDETPHDYDRADDREAVVVPLWGRDRYAVLQPTERRGDLFERRLIVAYNDPSVVRGRAAFEALDDLGRAWSQTTVLDGDGNRWWAYVGVVRYEHREGGLRHHARVRVVETSVDPAPATVAWVPGGAPVVLTYGDSVSSVYSDGTYGTT